MFVLYFRCSFLAIDTVTLLCSLLIVFLLVSKQLIVGWLMLILPISPVEFRMDGCWVNSCPVVVLSEEFFIHTVLQTVWDTT